MAAVAAIMGGLASMQNVSAYQSAKTRAMDDLRTTAGTFAKDARHAARVVSASEDEVVLETYVGSALQNVRYHVVTTGGERNLLREAAGGSRLFVIRLTDDSIFEYDVADPATEADRIRRVALHLESKPRTKFPAVVLETEVSLRNVTA